ncbi:MAG: hypothetical protein NT042_15930 [Sulfuritalea sp.]|nr:hypothetical protein [Sulfuritalea sp.]
MNCTPHRIASLLLPFVATALLSACASTAPGGRSQLGVPEPISALYSSIDLNLTLASLSAVGTSCEGVQCQVDKGFERQVARLGTRLATAAYETYPDLKERIPRFDFVVAEKIEAGSSSDTSGTIVIYRGVRRARIDEETLAYLIAREMGHVIARHHDETSAATIISSLIAQLVLAPANLARGVAFIASSTAGAFGKDLMASGKIPEQRKEADIIALALLARQGWSDTEIVDSLLDYSNRLGKDPWSKEVERIAMRINNYRSADAVALAEPVLR